MNAGAGSIGTAKCDERKAEILAAFTAAGIRADIHLCEPARLTETARHLAATGVDAVVAAGGDGTVSAVDAPEKAYRHGRGNERLIKIAETATPA
jgi:diacylglycerol kinase family enzyme